MRPGFASPLQSCVTNVLIGALLSMALYLMFEGAASFSDEGSVCTIAQGILQGDQPYTHYFNEKAPLQYYWAAIVMGITGADGISGVRIASSITLALTLAVLLQLATQSSSRTRDALLWALALLLAGLSLRVFNGTVESSLALLHVLSVWLALHAPPSISVKTSGFLIGCLQGLAIGLRQQSLAVAVCLLLQPGARFDRKAWCIGLLAGSLVWVLLLQQTHALTAYVDANLFVADSQPFQSGYWHRPDRNDAAALLGWFALGAVMLRSPTSTPHKLWVLALTVCAAIPFLGRMDAFRLWPSFVVLLACVLATPHGKRTRLGMLGILAGTGLTWLLLSTPMESQARYRDIALEIQRASQPQERIWVGPYDPNVYCHAGRKPASRYYFMLPWISNAQSRDVLDKDLSTVRPKLIVDVSRKTDDWDNTAPAVPALLQTEYQQIHVGKGFRLYQSRDAAGSTSPKNEAY